MSLPKTPPRPSDMPLPVPLSSRRSAHRATPRWTTGGPAMDELWRQTIETRLIAAETRHAVDEVHRSNLEKRLGGIEDTLKWLVRLIIGGMAMAMLGYLLKGGFTLG